MSEIPGNILQPFVALVMPVKETGRKALIKPRGTANSHISIKSQRNPHLESPPERKIPQITVVFMACPST